MFSYKIILILCCTLTRISYASGPLCSPFHYQEQMLEKMIKLEMLVQKMKDDMDATQQRVLEMTQRLDDDVNVIKSEWKTERTLIRNTSAEIMKENRESAKMLSVAFQAKDLANTSPSNNEIFVYKTTLLNEGQGYDNATGKFTAPVTGTYLFTAQFCVYGGSSKYTHYAFVVDGEFMKRGNFYDNYVFSYYTADAIIPLKPGTQVWLMTPVITTTFHQSDSYWNSFSGVLVHQINSRAA